MLIAVVAKENWIVLTGTPALSRVITDGTFSFGIIHSLRVLRLAQLLVVSLLLGALLPDSDLDMRQPMGSTHSLPRAAIFEHA